MNKVVWAGLIVAILTPLVTVLQGETVTLYTITFSVLIAASSFLSRNMQGQVWTIVGILGAGLVNFFTAHPEPSEGITVKYVIGTYVLPLLIQIIGAVAHNPNTTPTPPQE